MHNFNNYPVRPVNNIQQSDGPNPYHNAYSPFILLHLCTIGPPCKATLLAVSALDMHSPAATHHVTSSYTSNLSQAAMPGKGLGCRPLQ